MAVDRILGRLTAAQSRVESVDINHIFSAAFGVVSCLLQTLQSALKAEGSEDFRTAFICDGEV